MWLLVSIAILIVAMISGFVMSGLALVLFSEKVLCGYSMNVTIGYLWDNCDDLLRIDEPTARRAVALNIQCRVLAILVAGLFMGGLFFTVGSLIGNNGMKAAIWMAGLMAFIRAGTLAIREFGYWPEIALCERVEVAWTSERPMEPWCDISFRKIIVEDGDENLVRVRYDSMASGSILPTRGGMYVLMRPPIGETVCVPVKM